MNKYSDRFSTQMAVSLLASSIAFSEFYRFLFVAVAKITSEILPSVRMTV
jgi:hypothetical protein